MIKEIPRQFIYVCDRCHAEHIQENASGHDYNSRPPYWARILVHRDAYDYQGSPVADGSSERLICAACLATLDSLLAGWFKDGHRDDQSA